MSDNPFKQKADVFLQDIWGKRDLGLPELNWQKPIRHEDVLYLLKTYPYLQIISTEPSFPAVLKPEFISAASGWIIHDYGDAMSASRGKDLFGAGSPDLMINVKEEDGGNGGDVGSSGGKGTIIKQSFDTAYTMVVLAMEKQWPGVEIIAGTRLMQWAAWMAAQDHEYLLQGFTPEEEEEAKRNRILKLYGKKAIHLAPALRPGRGR